MKLTLVAKVLYKAELRTNSPISSTPLKSGFDLSIMPSMLEIIMPSMPANQLASMHEIIIDNVFL
jgi:hypothetical protein